MGFEPGLVVSSTWPFWMKWYHTKRLLKWTPKILEIQNKYQIVNKTNLFLMYVKNSIIIGLKADYEVSYTIIFKGLFLESPCEFYFQIIKIRYCLSKITLKFKGIFFAIFRLWYNRDMNKLWWFPMPTRVFSLFEMLHSKDSKLKVISHYRKTTIKSWKEDLVV